MHSVRDKLLGTMRRKIIQICASICVFASLSFAQDAQKPKSVYETMVQKIKSGDKTVDFKQLRMAYSEAPSAVDTDPQKEAMMAALNAGQFSEAVKDADAVLAANYVDMDAHVVESIAHRKLNENEQADFHRYVYDELIKSILSSGNGKEPSTAYVVISVHEEYVVLRAIGIPPFPMKQSLLHNDGHSYDALDVKRS